MHLTQIGALCYIISKFHPHCIKFHSIITYFPVPLSCFIVIIKTLFLYSWLIGGEPDCGASGPGFKSGFFHNDPDAPQCNTVNLRVETSPWGKKKKIIKNNSILQAIKNIFKGEEICENYGPIFFHSAKDDRQSRLLKQYWFQCNCQVRGLFNAALCKIIWMYSTITITKLQFNFFYFFLLCF